MRDELAWMLLLILPLLMVTSRPVQEDNGHNLKVDFNASSPVADKSEDEEVISVSITSSVAVGRGKGKRQDETRTKTTEILEPDDLAAHESVSSSNGTQQDVSPSLAGANIEFIKQLHSKKEARGTHHLEQIHPFQLQIKNFMANDSIEPTDQDVAKQTLHIPDKNYKMNEDSIDPTDQDVAKQTLHISDKNDEMHEDSIEPTHQDVAKQTLHIPDKNDEMHEDIENIPLGRSIALSPSSQNYIQGLSQPSERGQGPRLTTVSFNIVHDTPKTITNYEQSKPAQTFPDLQPLYSEPLKIYSQPAQVYSEPAKFYSEPAKVYSEPAKVYSEPAKVYSEPAKIYSEPAKFYSPPASLNLPSPDAPNPTPWQETQPPSSILETTVDTTPRTTTFVPPSPAVHEISEHRPEKNYEVDEKESVLSDGQSHGVQEEGGESCKDDSCKVGYVVEGRQYRKYRVEERTSDGFIVGEYGVVRNEDGALRGVRYTADGDASPRLIYDALMKFLQLK